MNKNEQLEVIIEGYSFDGYGVCKPGGYVLFVPGAIKGERLRVKVLKAAKNYGYAKIIDILTPSPERIAPLCPDCDKCGGCQVWHMGTGLCCDSPVWRRLTALYLSAGQSLRVQKGRLPALF